MSENNEGQKVPLLSGLAARATELLRPLDPTPQAKRRRRGLLALGILGLAWVVFGGPQGLWSLGSSLHERWALGREIESLKKENADLQQRSLALASDRAYYEKVAREKLMLKQPGELIYRF